MAQYLPYIQNQQPEPVLYQPDFNFFNSMLEKKQSQYEQGLSQAATAYNSVANAALSNMNNIPIRDQYLKQAKDQLKKISGSDLSLPQNIQAAQSIYSPFWEDQYILMDQNLTSYKRTQDAKLDAWRDSPDPKTRGMYSPIVQQYLDNGQKKLQIAARTPQDFGKLERREAVPFTNIQEYLQDMAKKNGDGEGALKIVYDETNKDGAYLISTTNGQKSIKAFSTWAEGMIANNFDEQFKITGIVTQENLQQWLKSKPENANATDDEIRYQQAQYVINNLETGYTRRLGNIKTQMEELNHQMSIFPDQIIDKEQKSRFNQLMDQYDELNQYKQNVQDEYDGFEMKKDKPSLENKQKIMEKIINNPGAYFQTLAKQQVISDWSTARAEITSTKITKNEAYFSKLDEQHKIETHALELQKQQDSHDKWVAELKEKYDHPPSSGKGKSGTTITNSDGTTSIVDEEGNVIDEGMHFLGVTGTDINQQGLTAYDVYAKHQATLVQQANDHMFNATNGMISLLETGGVLNLEDVTRLSSALKHGNDIDKWTKEQKEALTKFATGTNAKLNSVSDVKKAIMTYTENYFNKKKVNNIPTTPQERLITVNYVAADLAIKRFNANEDARHKLILKELSAKENQGKYTDITIDKKDKDGNPIKDIVQPEDLEKMLPDGIDYGIVFEGAKLTNKKIAELYYQGRIKIPGETRPLGTPIYAQNASFQKEQSGLSSGMNATVLIDGKLVKSKDPNINPLAVVLNATLNSKYKSSENLNKQVNKINNNIVPDKLFYEGKTALQGGKWEADITDPKKNIEQVRVFQEALTPSNQRGMYDIDPGTGKPTEMNTSDQEKLTSLLMNSENLHKLVGTYGFNTVGVNGHPTITFNPTKVNAKDKDQIGGDKIVDLLNKHPNIAIELNEDGMGPHLAKLPTTVDNYIYQDLLQGKSVKADDFLKSLGFDYEVQPNHDGTNNTEPTGGVSKVTMQVRVNSIDKDGNPTTTMTTPPPQKYIWSFNGANAKTPDEVVQQIHQAIMLQMEENEKRYEEYKAQIKAKGVTTTELPINRDEERKKKGMLN